MRACAIPRLLTLATLLAATCRAVAAPVLVNSIVIPGAGADRTPGNSANQNRLGGFFSDLYYDRSDDVYFGLVDRGPGGGTIGYDTRVQKFTLKVDPHTGAISRLRLKETILFTQDDGTHFNGFIPTLDPSNGNRSVLGRSFDPEGLAVGRNGHLYVSDEYGPTVREFNHKGKLIRDFTTPENLIPKQADGSIDYANGRPTITSGRQDNRGFEGLALSPDRKTIYTLLQDPLVNEGASNDGRRSRNLRMIAYDVRTGLPGAQYIYQLEDRADINARIPGTDNDFSATNQGRSIGISAIIAVNDHEFLVLERDNRGIGVDDPLGALPVGSKRIYKIDITGATDVSALSLAGNNDLPAGVVPVVKSLYFDIDAALKAASLPVPEKLEGLTIGPRLKDGSYALLLGTDNDFSVTQNSSGAQLDVCAGGGTSSQVPIDAGCPAGQSLLPTYLYSIKADGLEVVLRKHDRDDREDDEDDHGQEAHGR